MDHLANAFSVLELDADDNQVTPPPPPAASRGSGLGNTVEPFS